jgi:hypothetical protein
MQNIYQQIVTSRADLRAEYLIKSLWRNDMNEYDACEQAFKNGYKKAAEEIFEEIENYADFLFDGFRNIVVLTERDFAELKKKYTEGET